MTTRIPLATYRFQFNSQFPFAGAMPLLAYLEDLGVGDCYASPVLMARPGSLHGYDVVDHTRINPELGTEEEFVELARELKRRGLGLLMDAVPNHMCISSSENRWWHDVLENGPSSSFARFFDIDWNPPNVHLGNKVLLPILGDQYGRVLEAQEVKIIYRGGAFFATYYEHVLPVASRTSTLILAEALRDLKTRLDETHEDVLELESIMTALQHLPPRTENDPERIRERRREKEVVKRRLSTLVKTSGEVRHSVHEALTALNGTKGNPQSFDLLEALLAEQAYRLSYWRVAADEINYRRFFDINELAAVRVEERPVFTAVHEIIFRLMKQGLVTGLRIDHVDGLSDPEKYLKDLQRAALAALKPPQANGDGARDDGGERRPRYVIVEKILGHDEALRPEWPVHGTTGYDFMNLLNGVFVDEAQGPAFRQLYQRFTGHEVNFEDLLYDCKKLILQVAMSSELHVLARRLDRIAKQHRWSRDFTFNSLQHALGEVIACFPVYRSYVRRRHASIDPKDSQYIRAAVRQAKRRNPATERSIFDFLESLLLLRAQDGLDEAERRDFVLRFQQLTSPVTAKGLEDTAFYRYYPLASLNEVGGEPAVFGVSRERFHRVNRARQASWPQTLSATSTHDTKRSEDVRARINVLSEIPAEWERALERWRALNRERKTVIDGVAAPDANEEYLFYQTLVGTWPLDAPGPEERQEYIARIGAYMNKALKEAKVHTSWINPDEAYDRAVGEFVRAVLDPATGEPFLTDFVEFQRTTARAGMFNSLSQTLLKIASPGVPDFYQGSELWDLSLVDPDNRRPVDYETRRRALDSFRGAADTRALVDQLINRSEDGRVKLYVTSRALAVRRAEREVFEQGDYVPLETSGDRQAHVVAFARRGEGREVIAAAARFYTGLGVRGAGLPLGRAVWVNSSIRLGGETPPGSYRDAFTGCEIVPTAQGELPLAELFAHLPVALLVKARP